MKDSFGREISYMRISITDRCNLRCHYCMPQKGIELAPAEEILAFEEIVLVCQAAAELGCLLYTSDAADDANWG